MSSAMHPRRRPDVPVSAVCRPTARDAPAVPSAPGPATATATAGHAAHAGRSTPRPRRFFLHCAPGRLPVVLAACVFLMPSFLSPLFAARRDAGFPRLSENVAGTARQEVRKVLHGPLDGLFVVPEQRQVIAVAGGYLWRFDADGVLLDTLWAPGDMHRMGLAFGRDAYNDWIFSGEQAFKPYAPTVDGNALSPEALHAMFDAARAVSFDHDHAQAWALLWDGQRAWKVDLTRHRDKVHRGACGDRPRPQRRPDWLDSCMDGYTRTPPLRELAPESFARDVDDTLPPRLQVVDFDRRHFHLEEGIAGQLLGATVGVALKVAWDTPGRLPRRLWFGDAHVQLQVRDETLRFKVFVPREEDGYGFRHTLRWWEPATLMADASPWFDMRMRGEMHYPGEEALLRHYVDDIGLYVVRPVPDGPAGEAATPGWRPVFEGPGTRGKAVVGSVELASGARAHRWLRAPEPARRFEGDPPRVPVDGVWPPLQALPVAMTVEWGSPFDADAYTVVRIELPPEATRAAFAELAGASAPLELVLQAPDLFGATGTMQLLLRGDGRSVALPGARLTHLTRPLFQQRWTQGDPTRLAQLGKSADAARTGDAAALRMFLQQAQAMVDESAHVASRAAGVTAAYADLLIAFNTAGDATSSGLLVRHYLEQVHALTSVHTADPSLRYNVGVIASQTLAFALHRADAQDLLQATMTTLVGAQFDPAEQTNATLLYNLACYHASRGDRTRMLEHVAAAHRLGKPTAQFLRDTDFQPYWTDAAFRQAIGADRDR